jgi:hypothetical protein
MDGEEALAVGQQPGARGDQRFSGPTAGADHRRGCGDVRGVAGMGRAASAGLAVVAAGRRRCDPVRLGDLPAARALSRRSGAVAAAHGAPCRPRFRRHDRAAVSHAGDSALGGDQAGRGGGARSTSGGGGDFCSAAQRDVDVQSQQRPHAVMAGPSAAGVRRDAGHAPGAPFGPRAGDEQQLRVQSSLVGPAAGDLPGSTGGRPRGDDHRSLRATGRTRDGPPDRNAADAVPHRFGKNQISLHH